MCIRASALENVIVLRRPCFGGCLVIMIMAVVGCVDIPGTSAGEPCNSQGVCGSGLFCNEDGICRGEASESSWEVMRTPFTSKINGVWARSDSEVFAVGEQGRIYSYDGNGLDWTEQKHDLTTGSLRAVWGDDTQVFAVGSSAILRYDGGRWTAEQAIDSSKTAPDDELKSYTLHSVRGNIKSVYAVGSLTSYSDGLLLKRQSGRWHSVEEAELSFASRDLWLSGDKLTVVGKAAKQVRVLEGSTWKTQNLEEAVDLEAIWGNGEKLVAVGPGNQLLKFDGSQWEHLQQARESYPATAIWGEGKTFYVAGVGSYGGIEKCSERCVPMLLPDKATSKLYGIWGTKSWLYAVGDSGMILRRER